MRSVGHLKHSRGWIAALRVVERGLHVLNEPYGVAEWDPNLS